jgi:2-methylcitrate dehydratase PrpD
MDESPQRALARFVSETPAAWVAPAALARCGMALVDTLACSIAAIADPAVRQTARYLEALQAGPALPPSWLAPAARDIEHAALAGAVVAHAVDFDDVALAWRGHPSAVLFPALFALAGTTRTLGDVLAAYAFGFEVGAQLGRAVKGRHYERGWHSTATVGVIATTAACARLLGLDCVRTESALGLAVAQAGGVQANFGTAAKPMQAGFAAAAAVRAALLAQQNVTASPQALSGPAGFADLLADGALEAMTPGAAPAVITGIETKLYPACYAAHRAIEATLQLRADDATIVDRVASIRVLGSKNAHTPLLRRPPCDALEAKFSVEYAVARALVDGMVGLAAFAVEPAADPRVTALMTRTTVCESDEPAATRWGEVELRLHDGTVRRRRVTGLQGDAGGCPRAEIIEEKLGDCLASVGIAEEAGSIVTQAAQAVQSPAATLFAEGAVARVLAAARGMWSD